MIKIIDVRGRTLRVFKETERDWAVRVWADFNLKHASGQMSYGPYQIRDIEGKNDKVSGTNG
jgi:hypothetical protein